jgi:hypothetical protein
MGRMKRQKVGGEPLKKYLSIYLKFFPNLNTFYLGGGGGGGFEGRSVTILPNNTKEVSYYVSVRSTC